MLFIASYYIPATTHCQDTGTEILSATQDTGTEILSAVQDTGTEILSCCQDSISVPVSDNITIAYHIYGGYNRTYVVSGST